MRQAAPTGLPGTGSAGGSAPSGGGGELGWSGRSSSTAPGSRVVGGVSDASGGSGASGAEGLDEPPQPASASTITSGDSKVAGRMRTAYTPPVSSTLGVLFRVTTFGESHGPALGAVVDGCPPRLPIDAGAIQAELDRRRPGQSRLVSPRKEEDRVEILSGILGGETLGTPIAMMIRNQDARGKDYEDIARAYRPSHADYTYDAKYGIRAVAGGGRASARETAGRVAAGAIAQQLLRHRGVSIVAWVDEVWGIAAEVDEAAVTRAAVDATDVRCPDTAAAARMIERIERARKDGDSVGGVVRAIARGVPAGWGEPVFDKLEADLAKAMMSIPAVKGVENGAGFAGTRLTGSEHNDLFLRRPDGAIGTLTNRSGGIQGGISNGEPITLRIAFKPTATIMRPQETVDPDGNPATLQPKGRHDPCVLPRAVPIVEAMFALVLADHCLRQDARR
jgi:chorismate synthase